MELRMQLHKQKKEDNLHDRRENSGSPDTEPRERLGQNDKPIKKIYIKKIRRGPKY